MYSISPRSYAQRAKACLDVGSQEALFHAALELRCGIEARLQEYLEPHTHISVRQKYDYKIRRLGKSVQQITHAEEQIVKCTLMVDGAAVCSLYYTPVRASLRSAAERLGDLLHVARHHRPDDDPWWATTRAYLEETHAELSRACLGELLGSPLLNRDSGAGRLHMSVAGHVRDSIAEHLRPGKRMIVNIELHDEYPDDLLARELAGE